MSRTQESSMHTRARIQGHPQAAAAENPITVCFSPCHMGWGAGGAEKGMTLSRFE